MSTIKGLESTTKTLSSYNASKNDDGNFEVDGELYAPELVEIRGVVEIHRTAGSKRANRENLKALSDVRQKANDAGMSIIDYIASL